MILRALLCCETGLIEVSYGYFIGTGDKGK